MKKQTLTVLFLSLLTALSAQKTIKTLEVPAQNAFCRLNTEGSQLSGILPSGRVVTPIGTTIRVANGAFGLAVSADESKALILHHNGVLTLVDLKNPTTETQRIPSFDGKIAKLDNAVFLGVQFSMDGKTAYLSGGDKGNVVVFDINTLIKRDSINLDGKLDNTDFEDSFTSDLVINPSKNELLVLDRGNNRLVRVDLTSRKLTASIPVGRIPFGIALSKDGKKTFVANVGLYDYKLIEGVTPTNKDTMMALFPPFGLPSKEADTEGVTLPDGRHIPPLGSALAEEAMSVWVIDLEKNQTIAKLKTGVQIGTKIEGVDIIGGASPNSVAVGSRFAYVSNATNDVISVIDIQKNKLLRDIPLKIDSRIDKYRGMMPFGLCLSMDEKTLYVALLGLNAVAVVDVKKRRVKGYIPTGWGTTRVKLTQNDRKLLILSARGIGAGQNGGAGFVKPPRGTFIGDIQLGTCQIVDVPTDAQLKIWTQQVLDNTFQVVEKLDTNKICPPQPFGRTPQYKHVESPIKHIVYITKENRTFDEVFGQLPNVNADSTLARFGVNVTVKVKDSVVLRGASITPNHHKIAKKWALSDNFYCDSDASIHGHHWMVGTIPNEYVEANSAAEGRFDAFSTAKGRRFPKSAGGIDPEDYNEIGGLWENLSRNSVHFYNFGENNEFAGNFEEKFDTVLGAAHPIALAMPKPLFDNTCPDYAGYNTNIPDQFRVEQFERNFRRLWLSGKDTMPSFVSILLPNDHTASPRPDDGYPFAHSFVADNDLALGRILEFLSQTPYWKSMLVVVTEDDPQGGVDHIDAHRSILMMAGPFVKRGYVSHKHANFGSILKTMYAILGVPPVNQYDATATLLDDFFTSNPDFFPYRALSHDASLFQPEKAMRVYGRNFDWKAVKMSAKMDDEDDARTEHYRQQNGGH